LEEKIIGGVQMIEIVLFVIWFIAVVTFIGYLLSRSTWRIDREIKKYYEHHK